MRFTTRLFLYWVSIFLVFFAGIILVVFILWKVPITFWQAAIVFFIVGMIPPAIITLYFSKRLDYMESDDLAPPQFSGHKSAVFPFKGRTAHPFDEVLQLIDRQWIISFSDRERRVLKFRTDARMSSWGLGGYIKMEDDHSVNVTIYPIHPKSKRETLMVHQALRATRAILGNR